VPEIRESGHKIEFKVRAVLKPWDQVLKLVKRYYAAYETDIRFCFQEKYPFIDSKIRSRTEVSSLYILYKATSPVERHKICVEVRSYWWTSSWYEAEISLDREYKVFDPFEFTKPSIHSYKQVSLCDR